MAPFGGPVAPVFRFFGFRPWALNARVCRHCIGDLGKARGGAEVELSLLFADVRGSTSLAEHLRPADFSNLLPAFAAAAFGRRVEAIVPVRSPTLVVATAMVEAGSPAAGRAIR